jgi:hypothetical protein
MSKEFDSLMGLVELPEDKKYRGFDIPPILHRWWGNHAATWWTRGIDAVLDSEQFAMVSEEAWRYRDLSDS